MREDSVRDIGALLDWIAAQPDLDARRVAVYGGSYGGYMVLASLTHYSDRIRAGVDIVGVASFNTMLKTTSAYRRTCGGPSTATSAIPRCRPSSPASIRSTTRRRSIPPCSWPTVETIRASPSPRPSRSSPRFAPTGKPSGRSTPNNEGHGFQKKANRDYLNAAIAVFLKQNLGP